MNGRSSAIVMTRGVIGNAAENAKLVFDRYGDVTSLHKRRWQATRQLSLQCDQRSEQKQLGRNAKKKSVVVIVAE